MQWLAHTGTHTHTPIDTPEGCGYCALQLYFLSSTREVISCLQQPERPKDTRPHNRNTITPTKISHTHVYEVFIQYVHAGATSIDVLRIWICMLSQLIWLLYIFHVANTATKHTQTLRFFEAHFWVLPAFFF